MTRTGINTRKIRTDRTRRSETDEQFEDRASEYRTAETKRSLLEEIERIRTQPSTSKSYRSERNLKAIRTESEREFRTQILGRINAHDAATVRRGWQPQRQILRAAKAAPQFSYGVKAD